MVSRRVAAPAARHAGSDRACLVPSPTLVRAGALRRQPQLSTQRRGLRIRGALRWPAQHAAPVGAAARGVQGRRADPGRTAATRFAVARIGPARLRSPTRLRHDEHGARGCRDRRAEEKLAVVLSHSDGPARCVADRTGTAPGLAVHSRRAAAGVARGRVRPGRGLAQQRHACVLRRGLARHTAADAAGLVRLPGREGIARVGACPCAQTLRRPGQRVGHHADDVHAGAVCRCIGRGAAAAHAPAFPRQRRRHHGRAAARRARADVRAERRERLVARPRTRGVFHRQRLDAAGQRQPAAALRRLPHARRRARVAEPRDAQCTPLDRAAAPRRAARRCRRQRHAGTGRSSVVVGLRARRLVLSIADQRRLDRLVGPNLVHARRADRAVCRMDPGAATAGAAAALERRAGTRRSPESRCAAAHRLGRRGRARCDHALAAAVCERRRGHRLAARTRAGARRDRWFCRAHPCARW